MSTSSQDKASAIRPTVLIGVTAVVIALFLSLSFMTREEEGQPINGATEASGSATVNVPDHNAAANQSAAGEAFTHTPETLRVWAELESELHKLSTADDRDAAAAELALWFREQIWEDPLGVGGWFSEKLQEQRHSIGLDPDRGYRMMGFQIFLTEWGSMDGENALAYVQKLGDEKVIPPAHDQRVIEGWIRDDVESAMAFLWQVPEEVDNQTMETICRRMSYFADAIWRIYPANYMDWIRQMSSDWSNETGEMDPRGQACVERLGALANGEHFRAAGEILWQHERALDYQSVLRPFAKRYARAQPAEALEWAIKSRSTDNATPLVNDILREVARSDPDAGIDLINGPTGSRIIDKLSRTGDSSAVDELVSQFIWSVVDHHGSDRDWLVMALDSLNAINDQTIRTQTTEPVEDTIRRFHTAAAIPEFYAELSGE